MFDKLSFKITDMLIENGTISCEQRNLYNYSISGMIQMGSNFPLTLMIGLLLGRFVESIIFLIVFIPLRTICGGYHNESNIKCFFISLLIVVTVLSSATLVNILPQIVIHTAFILSVVVICALSPVDNKNKRLDNPKKEKMKKLSLRCVAIIMVIYCILVVFNLTELYATLTSTMLLIDFLLILGMISDKIYRSHSKNDRFNRF